MDGFLKEDAGMVPFSTLGIVMLLIVGLAIYHFGSLDFFHAKRISAQTSEMETFYSTVAIGQEMQQIAREEAEYAVTRDSISTYGDPIDIDEEWRNKEAFEEWKEDLEKEIENAVQEAIYRFYDGGDPVTLQQRYYNPLTEFDFSNFMDSKQDIHVEMERDHYDSGTQYRLMARIGFNKGGIVNSRNRYTGHEMSYNVSALVSINSRPFTMADKVYEFTKILKKRAPEPQNPLHCIVKGESGYNTADELAWYLWGMQEVLGLMEANTRHSIRFATDERAAYSLMHLIIAYKEMEHFGTFDYLHTSLEFLKPWIGREEEGREFLSIIQNMDKGYAAQAAQMMGASAFVEDLWREVMEISRALILAASHLDSRTVTEDGKGFPLEEVKGLSLPKDGLRQHLEKANDTSNLEGVYKAIIQVKHGVEGAKGDVESPAIKAGWDNELLDQTFILRDEWLEVREEWKAGKEDLWASKSRLSSAKLGYYNLSKLIDGEKCNNPLAAMLWFGDPNQKVMGLNEILPSKEGETEELLDYYDELEEALDTLDYASVADCYEIDLHFEKAKEALEKARANIRKARRARDTYLDQKYKHDHCDTFVDYRDPKMGGCLGPGYPCYSYDCNPYPCNCEVDDEGEPSCDTCYMTCYHTCYDCICDMGILRRNYEEAEAEYKAYMVEAEEELTQAAEEVLALKAQINAFFEDKGLGDMYSMVRRAHGMHRSPTKLPLHSSPYPFSISDNYYGHWNFRHDRSVDNVAHDFMYRCAGKMLPKNTTPITPSNYASQMPSSPLSYDGAHKNYTDYGLFYIKNMVGGMEKTMTDKSLNAETMERAKEGLEEMIEKGYFETLTSLIEPIKNLVDYAGDIEGAMALLRNREEGFPNLEEHAYTTLPLPPINTSFMGFQDQGFTIMRDVRLRADTRPGKVDIPLVGTISLGKDNSINPSFPIPYTPIHLYLWGFEFTPSIQKDTPERSTIWLMDYENNVIAPLLEAKINSSSVPLPLYLHKPVMYKYEFTATEIVSKDSRFEYLPPVVVFALGPFSTRFGDYVEPPDKEDQMHSLTIDLSFEGSPVPSLSLETSEDLSNRNIYVFTHVTEGVNGNTHALKAGGDIILDGRTVFSLSTPRKRSLIISPGELQLLHRYGWSEIRADAYATDDPHSRLFDASGELAGRIAEVKGEDHAQMFIREEDISTIGIQMIRMDDTLRIANIGDRAVDISTSGEGCIFIKPLIPNANRSRGSWFGSINQGRWMDFEIINDGRASISARIIMPQKVVETFDKEGIVLRLHDTAYFE